MGLFSEFKASNKVEWETAIKSSLGDKSIDSLNYIVGDLEFPIIQMKEKLRTNEPSIDLEKLNQTTDNQSIKIIPWLQISKETNWNSIAPILNDLESKMIRELGLEIYEYQKEELEEILKGIENAPLEKIYIFLPLLNFEEADEILKVLMECGFPKKKIGLISPDVVSVLLKSRDNSRAMAWLENVQIHFPGVQSLFFDSNGLISRGFFPYEELAIMFEMVILLHNISEKNGMSMDKVFDLSRFRLPPGISFMEGISKIKIWQSISNSILQKIGISDEKRITAEIIPDKFSMSVFDVENNVLRQSSQMMVGFLAGAEVFHIYPYNEAREASSSLGSRTSSNLFFLLKDEAKLSAVISPLLGCYFLDDLNEKLAKEAWKLFQSFQAEGGIFNSESFQNLLKTADSRRNMAEARYLQGEIPQIGANLFPNRAEKVSVENESYTHQYLKDHNSRSMGLDQIRLSNANRKKVLVVMLGGGARRFGEANITGNLLGSIGIEVQIIEPHLVESCNSDDFEFLVMVGNIEELENETLEDIKTRGFGRIGVLGSNMDSQHPQFFKPDFILDSSDSLDIINNKILKNS